MKDYYLNSRILEDIDYHSNMYKTNSMFNLPQLHLKNKGLKSLNV